jgi:phosphate starvation-inducible PhoH-like protein
MIWLFNISNATLKYYCLTEGDQTLRARRKQQRFKVEEKVVNFNDFVERKKHVNLIPKTISQEDFISMLTNPKKQVVFAAGPAGTGKTLLAVLAGLKFYKEGAVERIVLTRPAVGVEDEKHGFLPGDLVRKMEPWTRPLFDVILEYYSPKEVARMIDENIIEISPLAFMRGRTFKNAWIVFDEAQNSTVNQMKMILTRLGDGSKIAITGDLDQTDRKFVDNNGLKDFISRLKHFSAKHIDGVYFTDQDVQRHPAVKEILSMYQTSA